MKMPDGTQSSGAFVAIFVILFGLAFVSMFAFIEDIGMAITWSLFFLFLGWVWIVVGETIVGDGGRRAQLEKETSERELRERSASTERARIRREITVNEAYTKEEDLDYAGALRIWESLGDRSEAKRIRKKMREEGKVKVDQTVVHGDYVDDRDTTYIDDRDTIIKDSVVSKSRIGGGSSTMQELKELSAMKKEGLITDEEFEKMKRKIIG